MENSYNDANVADTSQKTTGAINDLVVANPTSINTIDQEQKLSNTQEDRLNKAVNRLSNRGNLVTCVSSIPTFVVELNNSLKYLDQCPIQPLINVFLIVHGCASLLNGIVILISFLTANYMKKSHIRSPFTRWLLRISLIGQLILLLFSIAWLIIGQVWVFGAQRNGFQSSNATDTATYCNSTVFWTGFTIIIVTYAVWLILIIVFVVLFIKKRHKAKRETVPAMNEHS
jgi:hypothetical protein